MKLLTPQPGERHTSPRVPTGSPSSARIRQGWFRRLGRNVVVRKLDAATQSLVRREKRVSALIVALRIARELDVPLRKLDLHIANLDRLAAREPGIRTVTASLRRDQRAILSVIQRLLDLESPVDGDV